MNASAVMPKQEWEYQSERALIVPYVPSAAGGYFSQEFLAQLFLRTQKENLLRRTFPGVSSPTLNWFMHYFYSQTLLIGMVKPSEVAGYTWIYETDGDARFKKGSVGVCFFRQYFGNAIIQDLSRLGLRWYFQELGLNVIYGTAAAWNRPSVRFGKILGFDYVGRIPSFFLNNGNVSDMDLSILRREKFFELLAAKKESV